MSTTTVRELISRAYTARYTITATVQVPADVPEDQDETWIFDHTGVKLSGPSVVEVDIDQESFDRESSCDEYDEYEYDEDEDAS